MHVCVIVHVQLVQFVPEQQDSLVELLTVQAPAKLGVFAVPPREFGAVILLHLGVGAAPHKIQPQLEFITLGTFGKIVLVSWLRFTILVFLWEVFH